MTICIPHYSNTVGLAALLVNLQPQLQNTDIIYIVDTSEKHTGLEIARMYGSSRCPILIECNHYTIYEAWNVGIESMQENNQEGILILNDDVLLSHTYINNIKKAQKQTLALALVPTTPDRAWVSRRLDPNFTWFNSSLTKYDLVKTDWLTGFAFYLTSKCIEKVGIFNTNYKVWFGDTEYEDRIKQHGLIRRLKNEFVYHFGSSSYSYQSETVKVQIDKDRDVYTKWQKTQNNGSVSKNQSRSNRKD